MILASAVPRVEVEYECEIHDCGGSMWPIGIGVALLLLILRSRGDRPGVEKEAMTTETPERPRINFDCAHREHERLTKCPDYPLPDPDGEWEAMRAAIRTTNQEDGK